jgi:murein DD-endopeptidase MepM/ murein hydrolase activator NlpD
MAGLFGFDPSEIIRGVGNAFHSLLPPPARGPGREPADHIAGAGRIMPAIVNSSLPMPAGANWAVPKMLPAPTTRGIGVPPVMTPGGYLRPPASTSAVSNPFDIFTALGRQAAYNEKQAAANKIPATTSGGASTGMSPGVAKWATQTQEVFGDLGADIPDAMLAIMTNESGGDPNAYNPAGDAWGLFQNVGLGSRDPNAQFAAAHTLAQQKLASIAQSYKANGLNPNARTRALDLALAWAGHFDYGTGRANPTSTDIGSGQTAVELTTIFLRNYDAIKAGRSAPTGGGTGLAAVTGGKVFPIMQGFGRTDYSVQHPSTYAYGKSFGLAGDEHPGIDWAAPMGTQVYTPVGGVVSVVGNDHGTGYYYTNTMSGSDLDHSGEFAITLDNGDIVILGHMASINAQVGQRLNAGTLIGLSGGSDGSHVHIEVRRKNPNGGYTAVDPATYFGGGR